MTKGNYTINPAIWQRLFEENDEAFFRPEPPPPRRPLAGGGAQKTDGVSLTPPVSRSVLAFQQHMGPPRSPEERARWGEEGQRSVCAFAAGGRSVRGACPDERRPVQPDIPPLSMAADGAVLRGDGGLDDLPAVEAHPQGLPLLGKEAALLQQVGYHAESVPMGLFDLGHQLELPADEVKALLVGDPGELGVVVLKLLVLVVPGGLQQVHRLIRQVDGVVTVNGDVLPCGGQKQVVKHLGVGPLLIGGELKDPGHRLHLLLPGGGGGDGVAVAGLALPGKGAHQVFTGLALHEVHAALVVVLVNVLHGDPSKCIGRDSMPGLAKKFHESPPCHPPGAGRIHWIDDEYRTGGIDDAAGKEYLGGGGRSPSGGSGGAAGRRRPQRTYLRPGAGRGGQMRAVHGGGGPGGLRGAPPARGGAGRAAQRPPGGGGPRAGRDPGRPAPRPAGVRRDDGGGAGADGGGAGAGPPGLLCPGGAGGDERGACRVSGMVTVGRRGRMPGRVGPARAFHCHKNWINNTWSYYTLKVSFCKPPQFIYGQNFME